MIGELLRNRYEVLELVDEGAIFYVYRAKDRMSGRDFMVRLLKSPFDRETAFHEELQEIVKDLSVISSPLVERLVDVDNFEGITYILSEAKSGQKLSDRIRKLAPYTVPVAVSMVLQILEAIHSVNSQGFAHGEITSVHILVNTDGKLFLLQPGLWVAYGASSTAGKAILPILAPYLAPEVFEGRMMPSPTSDVYGVGVIMFELLAGRLPYQADSPAGFLQKHLTAPIPSIRQYNQSVPTFVEEFIKKALAKHPQHRYINARSMMSDLRMIQDALRFGRHLEWPIKGSESVADSAPVISPKGGLPPNYFEPAPPADLPVDLELFDKASQIPDEVGQATAFAVIEPEQLVTKPKVEVTETHISRLSNKVNSTEPVVEVVQCASVSENSNVHSHGPETQLGNTIQNSPSEADTEAFKWPSAGNQNSATSASTSQRSSSNSKGKVSASSGKDWRPKPQPIKPADPANTPNRRSKEIDEFADRMPKWASFLTFLSVCIIVLVVSGGLFWFNSKPKLIQVPNLVGSSVSEAQQKLHDIGIVMQVSRKEYSETKPAGVILELNPRPGNDVKYNGTVRAVVSSGSKFVEVPDLRGLTEEAATEMLADLDLEIAKPINDVRSTRLKPGQIVNQIPNKTSKVERGTKVRIEVASNRTRVKDADRRVRAEYELAVRIPQSNDPVKVRVDVVDADGVRTVYDDTQHQPGDEFFVTAEGVGDEIYFKVFYDGILVLQKSVKPEELIAR